MSTRRDNLIHVLYVHNKETIELIKCALAPIKKIGLSGKGLPALGAIVLNRRHDQIKDTLQKIK